LTDWGVAVGKKEKVAYSS